MSELQRYGLEWKSETDFVYHPMADGYWTPWHIATEEITRLQSEIKRLQERVSELENRVEHMRQAGNRVMSYCADHSEWVEAISPDRNSTAWLLRKQADAVEAAMNNEMAVFRLHNGTKRSGCFAQDLSSYAQRLRQQASELDP